MIAYDIPQTYNPIGLEDLKSEFFATRPRDVDGIHNSSTLYYRKWMLKKIFSIFEFAGIPETWDYDYLLSALFLNGYFTITDTELGVLPLICGVTGINVFNHPTEVIIANPVLGSLRRTIDEDCALVKLQYDYTGVSDILRRYSDLLAMCDSSIAVNLMNSKVTMIGLAADKKQAQTMKKMYDMITCGEPAVFVKGDVIAEDKFFFNHVRENFVADDIQLVKRKLINEFLTEIGINNANMDKRERVNTEEVAANDEEIRANIEHWLYNINDGLRVANRLYDLDLKCSVRKFQTMQEVYNDAPEFN